MKVVLLAINAKYIHSSLSVWVLAGSVSQYARLPHEVKVVEATINKHDEDIIQLVASHAPDVVGVSTYIWNAGKLPGLLSSLREHLPGAVFVLGGPEASHNAEYWLSRGADYVLSGEGERNFPALLDTLSGFNGTSPDTDCGFVNPYTDTYFDALCGRIAYIETSRGCPYHCAFCLSGGTGVRFFPLDTAKEQLRKLALSGTQTVKFVDRTFNCNAERAYELFSYVIGLDTPCCFHFEVAADLFDDRTLSLLRTAPPGRIQLEAGLQSFHQPTLDAVSRKTDLDRAERNLRTLIQSGNIHIHIDLIAGLPYETLSIFQESFDRAYALGADNLQLGFLKLLHGSALREQAEKWGIRYNPNPPYEIVISPWLSEGDLRILKQAENALRNTRNKGRLHKTLPYILEVSNLRPFELFCKLGKAAPHHATHLDVYAERIYNFFLSLPGVHEDTLRKHMASDWVDMTKGENLPAFLKP